jgi:hypothetical protein
MKKIFLHLVFTVISGAIVLSVGCHGLGRQSTVQPPSGLCKDLKKADCDKRIDCVTNVASTCEDAANKNDCGNVKEENACKLSYGTICEWKNGICANNGSSTSVTHYKIDKLDSGTTHKVRDDKIYAVTASKNGDFIYVISNDNFKDGGLKKLVLVSFSANTWNHPMPESFRAAHNADPLNNFDVFKRVVSYAPLEDGLFFWVQDQGPVHMKGSGYDSSVRFVNQAMWKAGDGNLLHEDALAMFEAIHGANKFLYVAQPFGVRFVKEADELNVPAARGNKAYIDAKWDNTLKEDGINAFDKAVNAFGQAPNGDLLLAGRGGIKKVDAADVGEPNKTLADGGAPIYPIEAFSLDNGTTNNSVINAIAVVDNKYLLVGLMGSAANTGGLVYADLTEAQDLTKSANWLKFGQGMSVTVKAIDMGTKDKNVALITTNEGLLIFKDGALIKVGGSELIDKALIAKNVGDARTSGFIGDFASDELRGAGQEKGGLWYIGSADGVYTLEMSTAP